MTLLRYSSLCHGLARYRSLRSRPAADPVTQILTLLREQLKVIRAEEPGTRRRTDPEELHKMRAAVRRLRAILGGAGHV